MCFDSNVNRHGVDSCSHQMSAQIRKAIAEIFVYVDFHLYYTEPDSPHGGLFKVGGLFIRKQLKVGGFFGRGFIRDFIV